MDRKRMLVEGMVAGFLAYLVVAGFFVLVNLGMGRSPFHTAFLLGEAIGAQGPGVNGTVGVILAANALHLIISMTVALAAAWLVMELEHHHAMWYGVMMVFLGGFFLSVVVMGMLTAQIAPVVSWPQVAAANFMGAFVIGRYLWRSHLPLIQSLKEEFGS